MIIRLLYILPMIIGRTFDIKKNSVGVDIFPLEDINQPRVNQENFYQSSYKVVETSSDVKDILSVSGDLSLSIKSGMFTIKGVGSYLKESMNSQNAVDILTRVSFRTVSKSLPHSAVPVPGWHTRDKRYLGTHFIRSILYGGDLIACVRFRAARKEDLQDIRGTVKTSLASGSALDLVGEGKLENLDKELEGKATMEINYFATVPLEGVPNDIKGLRELVKNFEKHVSKVNDGMGVPVEVELGELSSLNENFAYVKNTDFEAELNFFEEYLDDLLSTKSSLKSWVNSVIESFTAEQRKMISDFHERLNKITRKFVDTIADLDIEKAINQLEPAKIAYREGKAFAMAGKFRRELLKLQKKIVVSERIEEDKGKSFYVHYGSNQCAGDEKTTTVFSGYLASSPRNVTGSGFNYLCLPKVPTEVENEQTLEEDGSSIAGVKYGLMENSPYDNNEDDHVLRSVACSTCLVAQRSTVFTFLGQDNCPEGSDWVLQYSGHLMASTSADRSQTVCVDSNHEYQPDSDEGFNDQNLNFVIVKGEKHKFVPCAVCTK